MCCLQFEKDAYNDARKRMPKVGRKIRTPRGIGTVCEVNLIEEIVAVKFIQDDVQEIEEYEWAGLEPLNSDFKPGCPEYSCTTCPGCASKFDSNGKYTGNNADKRDEREDA